MVPVSDKETISKIFYVRSEQSDRIVHSAFYKDKKVTNVGMHSNQTGQYTHWLVEGTKEDVLWFELTYR